MERKKLPRANTTSDPQRVEIVKISPSDIQNSKTLQRNDISEKINLEKTKNVGRSIDALNNLFSIAGKLIEMQNIKVQTERERKMMEDQRKNMILASEIFVKEQVEKRKRVLDGKDEFLEVLRSIVSTSSDVNINSETKKVTMEFITVVYLERLKSTNQ